MLRTSILCFFLTSPLAHAQAMDQCMLAAELDAALIDWHGERVVSELEDGSEALWHNGESGSWTIVRYLPTGLACVLDYGAELPSEDKPIQRFAALPR